MAVSDLAPSDALTARLEELLERARSIKQSAKINPPLLVSELAKDDRGLFAPVSVEKDIHIVAFEKAAKSLFYSKIVGMHRDLLCPLLT